MSVAGPNLFVSTWSHGVDVPAVGSSLVAAGDIESTRLVYAMVIGLAAIGALFVFLGIWVIRQTRVDLEMLAPLERMGDRDWRKSDPASQRRSLDEVRPDGAEPIQPEPHRPRVDAEFGQSDRPVESFADLARIGPEGGDPTPKGTETPAGVGGIEPVVALSDPNTEGDSEIADAAIEPERAAQSDPATESPCEQDDGGDGTDGVSSEGTTERVEQ